MCGMLLAHLGKLDPGVAPRPCVEALQWAAGRLSTQALRDAAVQAGAIGEAAGAGLCAGDHCAQAVPTHLPTQQGPTRRMTHLGCRLRPYGTELFPVRRSDEVTISGHSRVCTALRNLQAKGDPAEAVLRGTRVDNSIDPFFFGFQKTLQPHMTPASNVSLQAVLLSVTGS